MSDFMGWDVSESPLGCDVRKVRLRAGLTQKAAAGLVGMDVSNWERIESGTRNMRARSWRVFLERIQDAGRIRQLEKDLEIARLALGLYQSAGEAAGTIGEGDGEG